MIGQTTGKLEHGGGWRVVADQAGIAVPADLDTPEQIGFGAGEAIKPRRLEMRGRPENLDVGNKAQRCTAPVGRRSQLFEAGRRMATGEGLPEKLAIARHLDHSVARQTVDTKRVV